MCECGCGEFRPIVKLPAKGGWYALEVYPGCPDCTTTWGVGVTFVKAGSDEAEYLLDGVPDIAFDSRGMWGRPILDTALMREEFAKEAAHGDDDDSEAMYAFDQFVRRGGLRRVYYATAAARQPTEGRDDG